MATTMAAHKSSVSKENVIITVSTSSNFVISKTAAIILKAQLEKILSE